MKISKEQKLVVIYKHMLVWFAMMCKLLIKDLVYLSLLALTCLRFKIQKNGLNKSRNTIPMVCMNEYTHIES